MRLYESGATEKAVMADVPNFPFRMYKFSDMTQPAKSEIPILSFIGGDLDEVSKRPAMKRPEAKVAKVKATATKKRSAAVLDDAKDGEAGGMEVDAARQGVDAAVAHVRLHCFQITSTITSLPVRSYLTACKCSDPEPCICLW